MPNPETKNDVPGFRKFHRCRVAVVLDGDDWSTVVTGEAYFRVDEDLGGALYISSGRGDEPAVLVLVEASWSGCITRDTDHGCEFCFVPSNDEPATP